MAHKFDRLQAITQNQKKLEKFLKLRLLLITKIYVFVENCNFDEI